MGAFAFAYEAKAACGLTDAHAGGAPGGTAHGAAERYQAHALPRLNFECLENSAAPDDLGEGLASQGVHVHWSQRSSE